MFTTFGAKALVLGACFFKASLICQSIDVQMFDDKASLEMTSSRLDPIDSKSIIVYSYYSGVPRDWGPGWIGPPRLH